MICTKHARTWPVFINSRDRLSTLRQLVDWLTAAGHENLHIVDNASTYLPLLDYLHSVRSEIRVHYLGTNMGHLALWKAGLLEHLHVDTPYVYTDPDVLPCADCPADAVAYFASLLAEYPEKVKAGFGLRIDDLPPCYVHRGKVILWEEQFWAHALKPQVYEAPIDTTFALYRAGSSFAMQAVRTGPPYLARHLPWYADLSQPTAEDEYYRQHASPGISSWSGEHLPLSLDQAIEQLSAMAS